MAPDEPLRRYGGLAVAALLIAFVFLSPFGTCPAKAGFGVPCPGCGLTRATLALLRFDFAEVLRLHPLAFVISPVAGWLVLRPVLVEFAGLPSSFRPLSRVPRATWIILVVSLLLLWIIRMAGGLGGHPDTLDPSQGIVSRYALHLLR